MNKQSSLWEHGIIGIRVERQRICSGIDGLVADDYGFFAKVSGEDARDAGTEFGLVLRSMLPLVGLALWASQGLKGHGTEDEGGEYETHVE